MVRARPVVTWTLVALNTIIYLWDRQGSLFGPNIVFADLGMRPKEVVQAIQDASNSGPIVTLFTSMFLHGGPMHILMNMVFLVVFGRAVEDAIGSVRYAVYYLAWGILASLAQIYVMPSSSVPILGASGAIGGVLGAYFLLFPTSKIEIFVPILLQSFKWSAWVLLGVWFLWQIAIPQEGVANWEHAGGFLAGMLTILVVGGRNAVFRERLQRDSIQ